MEIYHQRSKWLDPKYYQSYHCSPSTNKKKPLKEDQIGTNNDNNQKNFMTYLDYVEPLKLPKIISDEDKELINLVKRDVLLDDSNPIMFKDVIGLVMILEFQTLFKNSHGELA